MGSFLNTLQIEPIAEFYNLYAFLRILNVFIEFDSAKNPMDSLVNFYFTFSCEIRDGLEISVYGTGKLTLCVWYR